MRLFILCLLFKNCYVETLFVLINNRIRAMCYRQLNCFKDLKEFRFHRLLLFEKYVRAMPHLNSDKDRLGPCVLENNYSSI